MGVKHYDKSFKERAVKLSIDRGNISQVAKSLGVSDSQLSKWRKNFDQYGINSFPGRLAVNSQHEKRRFRAPQLQNTCLSWDLGAV